MAARTPYALFGLPERFGLDEIQLRTRYDELRTQFHPDLFAHATAAERRAAEGMAADLNEAYRLLTDPLARAGWLLAQRGCDPFAEASVAMPPEFLERQMELREQLEELQEGVQAAEAIKLADEVQAEISSRFAELGQLIDERPAELDAAVQMARELKYLLQYESQARSLASGV